MINKFSTFTVCIQKQKKKDLDIPIQESQGSEGDADAFNFPGKHVEDYMFFPS